MRVARAERLAKISVRGVVQGVGFRPFVYQLATRYGLKGWVLNTSGDVRIEVEGDEDSLQGFIQDLEGKAPPLALIEDVSVESLPSFGYDRFEIRHSLSEEDRYQLISPDIATCDACKSELFSPSDRRYRYPFTNCTNCGPRFTIIEDIPYDRPRTTMRHFQMCPDCQREYDDPLDRRFHTQPNACPVCGPSLRLIAGDGKTIPGDEITISNQLLRGGKILAIKGLGGFHLACDATNDEAVKTLRERKRRPYKPLAIMLSTLDEIMEHSELSREEVELLTSPHCPIVLARWRDSSNVSRVVAPGLKYLGVMLPYTPLHHLLLHETGLPLVMTSGNISEEPIARDNDEALSRLGGIADYFLIHNRDIYARYDDSVASVEDGKTQLIRRARGYAPFPIHLPFKSRQVLGCGGELKNTFCLTREEHGFLSQHIGDMENIETLEHYENTIELYKKLFRIQPEVVACDMHPDYLSTRYALKLAKEQGIAIIPVQHHHAHIVSCMVENGVQEPVIGVAFDGTGYGSDGRIWGGEFLIADYKGFERKAHLEYVPMPGGDAAVERPYRMAISYLYTLLGENTLNGKLNFLNQVDSFEIDLVKKQVEKNINSPLTSSCGRLFDAVSALLGIRKRIDYEAQAAVELEMAAPDGFGDIKAYPFSILEQDGVRIIKLGDLFRAIIADMERGLAASEISLSFHHTLARMVARMCRTISDETDINMVALSGGVFQNRLLSRLAIAALKEVGLTVLTHSMVPTNDGGISLGQAVVANFVEC